MHDEPIAKRSSSLVLETEIALFPKGAADPKGEMSILEQYLRDHGFNRTQRREPTWILAVDLRNRGKFLVIVIFSEMSGHRDTWPTKRADSAVIWFGAVQNPAERKELSDDRTIHRRLLEQVLGNGFEFGQSRPIYTVPLTQ